MLWSWAFIAPSLADPVTIGLFVGSNRPGAGQEPLRFAQQDVERMLEVMREIGGLDEATSVVLADPSAEEVRHTLGSLREEVEQRSRDGDQTVFVFYYSGHARSQALTLGPSELALTELRAELEAVPSTVTVAFLDACQSGAFSSVKGVVPADTFSWNSAEVLLSEGLAVMASSTATELSQESETLQGSYFTHHLVSGLRGPADRNEDGAVSLDEAYDYAQHHTLVATSATRTGSQHVTLETQLRGRGDMVLTRPVTADAWLELDGPLRGRLLVVGEDGGAVVAEVVKQKGSFTLALPAGRYRVLARGEDEPVECPLSLTSGATTRLSEAACAQGADPGATTVKATPPTTRRGRRLQRQRDYIVEGIGVEYTGGLIGGWDTSDFYDTLRTFGFDTGTSLDTVAGLTVPIRVHRRVALAIAGTQLRGASYSREWFAPEEADQALYSIRAWRLGLYPRLAAPLGGRTFVTYVQGGMGVTHALATLDTDHAGISRTPHWGVHAAAAAGLQLMIRTKLVDFGGFLQVEGVVSPIVRNDFRERGNVGGIALQVGLRVAK